MIRKIVQRLNFYRSIRFFRYIYLNFFCKSVVRMDNSRLIPYKGAVIDIEPGAKLIVGGGDVEIGCDLLNGSVMETRVRLRRDAVWNSKGGCRVSYGSTVEVLSGGIIDSQFFTMNSDCVLIAAKSINLGCDVMIGRGVVIYDSDHHTIRDPQGVTTNADAPVKIGDHVWLATHATVLKGSTIGHGSIIGANATVHGDVPANTIYQENKSRTEYGSWSREHPYEH